MSPDGRRRRKRWCDTEVKTAIQARQVANREHRQSLRVGHEHMVIQNWKLSQTRKQYAKQLTQEKIRTADLRTVLDIRFSGKDASRKFRRYMGTLECRKQSTSVLDECTGQEVEDLGTHFTTYLEEMFFSRVHDHCQKSRMDSRVSFRCQLVGNR
ncbi:hypothetical protein ISCGN_005641 [Ixodes scapularis]